MRELSLNSSRRSLCDREAYPDCRAFSMRERWVILSRVMAFITSIRRRVMIRHKKAEAVPAASPPKWAAVWDADISSDAHRNIPSPAAANHFKGQRPISGSFIFLSGAEINVAATTDSVAADEPIRMASASTGIAAVRSR